MLVVITGHTRKGHCMQLPWTCIMEFTVWFIVSDCVKLLRSGYERKFITIASNNQSMTDKFLSRLSPDIATQLLAM